VTALIGGAVRFKGILCAAQALSDLGFQAPGYEREITISGTLVGCQKRWRCLACSRAFTQSVSNYTYADHTNFFCYAMGHCPNLDRLQLLDCLL
jgi:hypothetical protein